MKVLHSKQRNIIVCAENINWKLQKKILIMLSFLAHPVLIASIWSMQYNKMFTGNFNNKVLVDIW
jgi:hypothetical protein